MFKVCLMCCEVLQVVAETVSVCVFEWVCHVCGGMPGVQGLNEPLHINRRISSGREEGEFESTSS